MLRLHWSHLEEIVMRAQQRADLRTYVLSHPVVCDMTPAKQKAIEVQTQTMSAAALGLMLQGLDQQKQSAADD